MNYKNELRKKFTESLKAVGPVVIIVALLSLTLAPIPPGIMLLFLGGSILVLVGMMFFSLGATMAMETMGEKIGSGLTKTKKLWLILLVGFILGVIITIAEPDLQVLATQIPSVDKTTLIFTVAGGVGLFLVVAFLRMVLNIPLRILLIFFYGAVLILGFFTPKNFLSVAFDAGGVTTGPMTVPFIMAFGAGIAAIRNDRHAADDSFGLVALCSVGPILAVMIISMIVKPTETPVLEQLIVEISETTELRELFISELPTYLKELGLSLLPSVAIFGIFQIFTLHLNKTVLKKILIGLVFTYGGLVLFMTGVNIGFLPAGTYLGKLLAGLPYRFIILPIGMVIGYCIVNAEPAIYVLMHQVEDITNGMIRGKTLKQTLCISVSVSVGLAMLRILFDIPILYFVLPGYIIALLLSFFSPKIFTAIAFDSGGVASGPMTSTFLLPFAMGACAAVGNDIMTDAFGVVALVAMTPLLAIQVLGIIYSVKEKSRVTLPSSEGKETVDNFAIIEL